eukprot:7553628-Ditylum_brightwellii.AAC.1
MATEFFHPYQIVIDQKPEEGWVGVMPPYNKGSSLIHSLICPTYLPPGGKHLKICAYSLAAEAKEVTKKRKEVVNHQKAFRKEGW